MKRNPEAHHDGSAASGRIVVKLISKLGIFAQPTPLVSVIHWIWR